MTGFEFMASRFQANCRRLPRNSRFPPGAWGAP